MSKPTKNLFQPFNSIKLMFALAALSLSIASPSFAQSTQSPPIFSPSQKSTLFTDKGSPVTVYSNPQNMLNSHGLTFSDAQYYIPNQEVGKILSDEYEQIEKFKIDEQDTVLFLLGSPGDIIVFSAKLYSKEDDRLGKVINTKIIGGAKLIEINDKLVSLAPLDYPGQYRVVYFRKK